MGATSSTQRPPNNNNSSIITKPKIRLKKIPTQTLLFRKILKHNCQLIEESFATPVIDEDDLEEILSLIETNRSYLEAVSHNLRPRYRDSFQWYTEKCDKFYEKLCDVKYKAKEVEMKKIEEVFQNYHHKLDQRELDKQNNGEYDNNRLNNVQEQLQRIRSSMWDLHQEVVKFRGPKFGRLYYFFEESFLRYLQVLNGLNTVGDRNLNYELRAAKLFANDSLKLLSEMKDEKDFQETNDVVDYVDNDNDDGPEV